MAHVQQQQQQQVQVSKSQQKQIALEAQLLLETTQSCIESIRKLGDMYLEELKSSSKENTSNSSDNKDDIDTDMNWNSKGNVEKKQKPSSKHIFKQQMITGQLLNCLRMSMTDPGIVKNDYAKHLSMLEFGQFKKSLEKTNAPKVIMDKIAPFVDTMQVTLQDPKKSFVIPGPKLDSSTFNDDAVSDGMSKFLGGQHSVEKRQKDVLNNGDKYFQAHNKVLNTKESQNVINNVQNEKVDKKNVNAHSMFGGNSKFLDFDSAVGKIDENKMDKEVAERVMYGNGAYKEKSRQENQQRSQQLLENQT